MSGVLFLLLACVNVTLFVFAALFGIDARSFFFYPSFGLAGLGILLLIARGLRVILPMAVIIGFGSAGFWALAGATPTGLSFTPVVPILPALGAALFALRGWILLRGSASN